MFICFANEYLFGPSILLNSLFLLLYKYAILWYIKIPIYSPATGHLSFSLLYLYLYQYFTDLITVLLSFTVNTFLWYYFSFGYFSYLLFQMNMRVACWTDWKKIVVWFGTREIAQSVKFLLSKHEVLSSDSQYPGKSQARRNT